MHPSNEQSCGVLAEESIDQLLELAAGYAHLVCTIDDNPSFNSALSESAGEVSFDAFLDAYALVRQDDRVQRWSDQKLRKMCLLAMHAKLQERLLRERDGVQSEVPLPQNLRAEVRAYIRAMGEMLEVEWPYPTKNLAAIRRWEAQLRGEPVSWQGPRPTLDQSPKEFRQCLDEVLELLRGYRSPSLISQHRVCKELGLTRVELRAYLRKCGIDWKKDIKNRK